MWFGEAHFSTDDLLWFQLSLEIELTTLVRQMHWSFKRKNSNSLQAKHKLKNNNMIEVVVAVNR